MFPIRGPGATSGRGPCSGLSPLPPAVENDQRYYDCQQDCRRREAAEVQPARRRGLGEEVPERRSQRPGQDEDLAQNRMLFEATRNRQSSATTTSAPAKTSAPRRYPSPELSARKSPSAVPSVFEARMVAQ